MDFFRTPNELCGHLVFCFLFFFFFAFFIVTFTLRTNLLFIVSISLPQIGCLLLPSNVGNKVRDNESISTNHLIALKLILMLKNKLLHTPFANSSPCHPTHQASERTLYSTTKCIVCHIKGANYFGFKYSLACKCDLLLQDSGAIMNSFLEKWTQTWCGICLFRFSW